MQSFFNGMSGMFNFSKMLDNVSNNISNMNTPGFKGNDVFIRSLTADDGLLGATITSTSIRTDAGDLRQTANSTDLAIVGEGYFILQNENGENFYTRAGQFKFDENNKLVDGASGYSVMAVNNSNQLQTINVSNNRLLPPVATANIDLGGNLSSGAAIGVTSESTVTDISVFDASGTGHKLSAVFTKSAANTWDVVVNDANSVQVATFQVQFAVDGSPLTGFNTVTRSLTFGTLTQNVTFNIGATGSLAGITQLSTTSQPSMAVKDGHDAIGLKSLTIDEEGVIQFKYTDAETRTGQQIALANFTDPSVLESSFNGLFKSNTLQGLAYGKPDSGNFGSIQSKSIEMSNVDLTQEFADILIIQRGYQASSRVMSVSNDLLEQLFNNTRTK